MPGAEDPYWRVVTDSAGIAKDYVASLPTMWDAIEQTLGHRATFMTAEQREAAR